MQPELLSRKFGHQFLRSELLSQALTHRSFGSPHNERLEFLGDSILNCVVSTALFERFPTLKEGELSRQRANLVKQDTLAEIAQALDLGNHIRLGEGELKSGGFRRPSILADALEAVFGAIYLDAGFTVVQKAVLKLYEPRLAQVNPKASSKDAKTELQELLQAKKLPLPEYRLLETRGEAHAQEFEVECVVAGMAVNERGVGSSRRNAEQAAARSAIQRISSK